MKVFVLTTGRSGSCTFYQACKVIKNYHVTHEGKAGSLLPNCINYEEHRNWIEVSPQMVMVAPLLKQKYESAKWVHLIRDEESCVQSLARQSMGTLDDYARHWFQKFQPKPSEIARTFYTSVNAHITSFLQSIEEANKKTIVLNSDGVFFQDWREFWRWIGAEGNLDDSYIHWSRCYNSTNNRGRDNF